MTAPLVSNRYFDQRASPQPPRRMLCSVSILRAPPSADLVVFELAVEGVCRRSSLSELISCIENGPYEGVGLARLFGHSLTTHKGAVGRAIKVISVFHADLSSLHV